MIFFAYQKQAAGVERSVQKNRSRRFASNFPVDCVLIRGESGIHKVPWLQPEGTKGTQGAQGETGHHVGTTLLPCGMIFTGAPIIVIGMRTGITGIAPAPARATLS